MKRFRTWAWCLWVSWAALGVACAPPPARIVVQMTTTYSPRSDFDSVRVEVRDITGTVVHTDEGVPPSSSYARPVRLADIALAGPGPYFARVSLRHAGTEIASETRRRDVDGTAVVTVPIDRDCAVAHCSGELSACVGSICVPPTCTPETPELCPTPSCRDDAACAQVAGVPCLRRSCAAEGVCRAVADDALCAAGQVCDVRVGCIATMSPDPCANGVRDGSEVGVDCGGTCTSCIERITVAPDGSGQQGSSITAFISGDGSVVGFDSDAPNLVVGTSSGQHGLVRDRVRAETTLAVPHVASAPLVTPDGRYLLVVALPTGRPRTLYRVERATGTAEIASDGPTMADGDASMASITDDGARVFFVSGATNLVSGDTNGVADLFVHDFRDGSTRRIAFGGGPEPLAADLVVQVEGTGHFALVHTGSPLDPRDTNMGTDEYVVDLETGAIELVTVAMDGSVQAGQSAWGSLSRGGRYVGFVSGAPNLALGPPAGTTAFYLRDRVAGTTERIDLPQPGVPDSMPAFWRNLSITDDGRYVAFITSRVIRAGDGAFFGGLFVRDRLLGTTVRVDLDPSGAAADKDSEWCAFTPDGHALAFVSGSTNLVPGDYHSMMFQGDVFVAHGLW